MRRLTLVILILINSLTFSQDSGPKPETDKDQKVKKVWPYKFPIWGQKATDKGYKLQLPYGVSSQVYYTNQKMFIPKINVKFNDGKVYDVSDLVKIGDVKAEAFATSVRPNIWLFPFLSVYAVIGSAIANVNVPYESLELPDESIPLGVSSDVENEGYTYGVGTTFNGKISEMFFNVDFNMTWTAMERFDEPFPASMLSARFGHIFHVADKPLAVWLGASGQFLSASTVGKIVVKDLAPELAGKVAELTAARDANCQQIGGIWVPQGGSSYTPAQCIGVAALVDIASGVNDTSIAYEIEKKLQAVWGAVIGANYEINKNWYVRSEIGFTDKTSAMIGFEYRF